MHVRSRGFGDSDGEQVRTVHHPEVGRRADGVGESPEDRHGRIAQQWLHLASEGEDGEPEAAAAVGTAPDEPVLLEGDDQSIDDGAAHPEGRRDFRHGEALGGVGKHREDSKPPIKGLRGLLGHGG